MVPQRVDLSQNGEEPLADARAAQTPSVQGEVKGLTHRQFLKVLAAALGLVGAGAAVAEKAEATYIPGPPDVVNTDLSVQGDLTVDGSAGIGTASGTGLLQVRAGVNQDLWLSGPSNLGAGVSIAALNDALTALVPLEILGGPIVFTGSVGVGKTPQQPLDVNGNISATGMLLGPNPLLLSGSIKDGTGVRKLVDAQGCYNCFYSA